MKLQSNFKAPAASVASVENAKSDCPKCKHCVGNYEEKELMYSSMRHIDEYVSSCFFSFSSPSLPLLSRSVEQRVGMATDISFDVNGQGGEGGEVEERGDRIR